MINNIVLGLLSIWDFEIVKKKIIAKMIGNEDGLEISSNDIIKKRDKR